MKEKESPLCIREVTIRYDNIVLAYCMLRSIKDLVHGSIDILLLLGVQILCLLS